MLIIILRILPNILQYYVESSTVKNTRIDSNTLLYSGKFIRCGHKDTAYYANSTGYPGLYYTWRLTDFRNGMFHQSDFRARYLGHVTG